MCRFLIIVVLKVFQTINKDFVCIIDTDKNFMCRPVLINIFVAYKLCLISNYITLSLCNTSYLGLLFTHTVTPYPICTIQQKIVDSRSILSSDLLSLLYLVKAGGPAIHLCPQ